MARWVNIAKLSDRITADVPPSRRAPAMVQRSPSISELSIEVGAIQKPSLKRRASTPGTPESPGAPPSSTVIGEPEWYRRVCLHPHSKPRIAWDLCSMTFLLYNAFIVPLRICFDITDYCPEGIWIFESVTDWFFVRADFIFIPFALRSHAHHAITHTGDRHLHQLLHRRHDGGRAARPL